MMRKRWMLMACAGVASPGSLALAQSAPKFDYSIFNPTPRDLRRPLSADRPDSTESPYTVDAGALQIEWSFIEWTHNRDDGQTRRDTSIMPINLKVGLTNDMDVQVILRPYELVDGDPDAEGFGDLTVRVKVNLFGNDEGDLAAALLPFITFATGAEGVSADHVEGGLIVPVAWGFAEGWNLGGQVGIELVRAESEYETILSHTVVLGREITDELGAYVEYVAESAVDGDGRYSPSLSLGTTYGLSPDAQLDAGLVVGLDNPRTDDLTMFVGMTLRF